MREVPLTAQTRPVGKGAAHETRRTGYVPGILYGKGTEALAIKVNERELQRVLGTGAGRNNLIRLTVAGGADTGERTVVIKELQRDNLLGKPLHVDLFEVSLKMVLHTRVPLMFTGEERATAAGGVVQHQLREVEVESLPAQIPEHITVDASQLRPGEHLTVADIVPPEGVKIVTDPSEVILSIIAPRMAEEPPAPAPGATPEEPGRGGVEEGKE